MKKLFTLLFLLAVTVSSRAQVYSHDIFDNAYSPDTYNFDVDLNGTTDYTFYWINPTVGEWNCYMKALNGNQILKSGMSKFEEVTYQSGWGDSILVFTANTSLVTYNIGSYIGLRMNAGGGTYYYGYVNVSVAAYNQLGILVCGHNGTAGGKIETGATGLADGVHTISPYTNTGMYFSGNNCVLSHFNASYEGSSLQLYDLCGKKVAQAEVTGSVTSLNNNSFANGLYLAVLRFKNGTTTTQKVFVNR